jgi:hypothetical protein
MLRRRPIARAAVTTSVVVGTATAPATVERRQDRAAADFAIAGRRCERVTPSQCAQSTPLALPPGTHRDPFRVFARDVMIAYDYPYSGLLVDVVVLLVVRMAYLAFRVFVDIFRSHDLGGWARLCGRSSYS